MARDIFSRIGCDFFEPKIVSWFDWETDCQEMSGFQFSTSLDVLFPPPAAVTYDALCLTSFLFKVFDAFRLVGAFAPVDTFAHGLTTSF